MSIDYDNLNRTIQLGVFRWQQSAITIAIVTGNEEASQHAINEFSRLTGGERMKIVKITETEPRLQADQIAEFISEADELSQHICIQTRDD